jgi:deoxycytidylate deaminase
MSLGKTQLPRKPGILDTGPSRGTGTTIVTRDQNVVSLGFGDTRSDDTNTSLRDELDGDAGAWVGALQIVDQLLEILDRVDEEVG